MGNTTNGAVFADEAVGVRSNVLKKKLNKYVNYGVCHAIFFVGQVGLRRHHKRVGESSGRNVTKNYSKKAYTKKEIIQ